MKKEEELAAKITKEIVVKLIEVGRLSLNSFDDVWNQIYSSVVTSMERNKPDKVNTEHS